MSAPTLSQSQIDDLVSSFHRPAADTGPVVEEIDLHAPSKFDAALVGELTELHKAFSRVMTDRLGRDVRIPMTIDQVGVEQLTYDAYIRSMPNPSILALISLDPLPGQVLIETSPQLALILVDRMLGGPGRPIPPRPPTQLEMAILGLLADHPLAALAETFAGVVPVEPRLRGVELNPQFAHAVTPTEMVLAVTFSVVAEAAGPTTRGLLSLCYPLSVVNPIREAMRRTRWSGSSGPPTGAEALAAHLETVPVEVSVRTRTTAVPASELASLEVGDVVRLDHAVDDPFVGLVEGVESFECDLGQRAGVTAAGIRRWT